MEDPHIEINLGHDDMEGSPVPVPSIPISPSHRFIPSMNIVHSPRDTIITQEINGWNQESVNTVNTWKDKIAKTSYIYDYVSNKYKNKLDWLLIGIAIFSGFTTIVNTIASSLSVPNNTDKVPILNNSTTLYIPSSGANIYSWVIFAFTVAGAIAAGLAAIISYYIKLKNWQTFCESIAVNLTKLDQLYTIIDIQSTLPYEMREDALAFITKYAPQITDTINKFPNITPTDYDEANQHYMTSLYAPNTPKSEFRYVPIN